MVGLATIFTDPNAIEVFGFQTIPIGIVIVVWLSIPVVGRCVGIKTPCVEILLEHCAFFFKPFDSDTMGSKLCCTEAPGLRTCWDDDVVDIDAIDIPIRIGSINHEGDILVRSSRNVEVILLVGSAQRLFCNQ